MIAVDVRRTPLAATAARLAAVSEHCPLHVGLPGDDGWVSLASLRDADALGGWAGQLADSCGDRRAAAMDVGTGIVSAATHAWVLPVLADLRLPTADLADVWLHRHPTEGWVDGVALTDERLAVLPADCAAGDDRATVLADRQALHHALAERLARLQWLLDPLAATLPVGRAALWGALADAVGARALWLARELDADRPAAWAAAQEVLDALAAGQPALRVRPALLPVEHTGGTEWFSARGTCCLWYRTQPAPDPDGEGYCGTCPLRTPRSRVQRLRDHLNSQA
jgi:hypothetical protein